MTTTGGPAFPTDSEHQSGPSTWHYSGMTLRDYFAGQAMGGLLADHAVNATPDRIANLAYRMADAMLAERQKTQCTDATVRLLRRPSHGRPAS